MNILLIGSGGREHALAWKLARSPLCDTLYCAPGNAGIAQNATCVPLDIGAPQSVIGFARDNEIDLVVVGPETPLVEGLADHLTDAGILCFGASKAAARLEGSKAFMKDLCRKYHIPTAAYGRFTDPATAKEFIRQNTLPIVVKADGLAAGKGVIICTTQDEAYSAVDDMLSGQKFGQAGAEVVIEEFLDGEEVSYFALADGKTVLPLTGAQDHKRAYDGDQGPNTGGMGAYSPPPLLTKELEEKILTRIVRPTIDAMAAEGCPFTGVLFAGVMVKDGEPTLLEHNVRFGDPECQVLMMRLNADLADILLAAAKGELETVAPRVSWHPLAAITVVMAAQGYPDAYEKGTEIRNIDLAELPADVKVFHAGTRSEHGKILSHGGRVLNVTAIGETIQTARTKAYEACAKIDWPEGFYRKDIAWRAL
ncbi:MAG: phosphoribosylamine--glycine ligase [Rhodospirillales bacterium]|nr:phosphoribosylamine--glycine ligase [Rhodospirillales bacterium]